MSLTHGEVVIELNGAVYELRPTLKAMKRIQSHFQPNGLRAAMEAVYNFNSEHVAAIIAAGTDTPLSGLAAIEQAVFDHGVADATAMVTPYLTALLNPRGASGDDKPAKK